MTVRSLTRQPLTIVPSVQNDVDEYGNAVVGAAAGVAEFGFLEMKSSQETLLNRDTTVTKWHAILRPDSVVTALSTITFEGQTFQVDGEPWHVFNPRTAVVSHIEVDLTVVT
jgi:hypothetical protein